MVALFKLKARHYVELLVFLDIMEEKDPCRELLGSIYILYIKAKIALAETHLCRSPKNYFKKFELEETTNYNLEILDYLVRGESPGYNELSRKSWILFVLEITKILSKGKGDKFSIGKFYNKLLYKEFTDNIPLDCFREIMKIIEDKNPDSVVNRLKILRDKFYAHSDADMERMTDAMFPTFNEVWSLMDNVEECLMAIYKYYDSGINLDVNRFLQKYIREFERLYQFFQVTTDFRVTYRLKQKLGDSGYLAFRENIPL